VRSLAAPKELRSACDDYLVSLTLALNLWSRSVFR